MKEAFVIGICGASASGKTTVAKNIIAALDVPWVSLISMDSFYKGEVFKYFVGIDWSLSSLNQWKIG